MSNSHGKDATRAEDFAIFDKLPRSVKELLWEAPDSISSANVAHTQRKWSLTPTELYDEWYERLENHRRNVIRIAYGTGHPQYKEPKDV